MNDDNERSMDSNSSADNVEQHLQALEKTDYETLYYSQEQLFSSEELAKVVNEQRLNKLMAQSDEFLNGLNSEIIGFDEDSTN